MSSHLDQFASFDRGFQLLWPQDEQGVRELSERGQFILRNIGSLALCKTEYEKDMRSAAKEQYGPEPARFSAAFPRHALLDDAAPRSASMWPVAASTAALKSATSSRVSLRGNRLKFLVLKIFKPARV
jgi:hypothetical protein